MAAATASGAHKQRVLSLAELLKQKRQSSNAIDQGTEEAVDRLTAEVEACGEFVKALTKGRPPSPFTDPCLTVEDCAQFVSQIVVRTP